MSPPNQNKIHGWFNLSSSLKITDTLFNPLFYKDLWKALVEYTGLGKGGASQPITSGEILGAFLKTRASHVAQSSLYGYLKTRAGTRFPEMFEDPGLLLSMNMAKWQIWLACLSDLTVYIGGLIKQRTNCSNAQIGQLLGQVIESIMRETGTPEDASDEFGDTVEAVRRRIANVDYGVVTDDEFAFAESPAALYRWAPIADELKVRDKLIVRNSVRFRWQEIRRNTRKLLQAEELMALSAARQNNVTDPQTKRHG